MVSAFRIVVISTGVIGTSAVVRSTVGSVVCRRRGRNGRPLGTGLGRQGNHTRRGLSSHLLATGLDQRQEGHGQHRRREDRQQLSRAFAHRSGAGPAGVCRVVAGPPFFNTHYSTFLWSCPLLSATSVQDRCKETVMPESGSR